MVVAHNEREFWKVDFSLKHARKTKVQQRAQADVKRRGEIDVG